ncbi:MAG: hypothetical protein KAJ51_06650 [Thermoplasmata archaeon]|nr:hypothetical protein [Thermoplasmata archaeon]
MVDQPLTIKTTVKIMVRFYKETYKIRRAAQAGHEITLPPLWVKNTTKAGSKARVLFDTIVVIVPEGIEIDEKILSRAVIDSESG